MKRLFSCLLSAILMVSSTLCFGGLAVADGVLPDQTLAVESLAQCFSRQVTQDKDVKDCDSLLESERKALTSVKLSTYQRCNALEDKVETNKPEYLRLYEVRDCHFFIENSPFWTKIYYGDSDAPCKYNDLYNEYVCE